MRIQRSHRSKHSLLLRITIAVSILIWTLVLVLVVQAALRHMAVSNSIPYRAPDAGRIAPKVSAGIPQRLMIPSINLDAIIAPAGLTPDGAMDIKKDPDQVAWYEFGTKPGDEGSAVIAGHYGWTGQHPSVFNKLQQLVKGDTVSVMDQNGVTTTFIVRGSQKFDPTADATAIFQSYDGKAHLNLITCDGVWVNAAGSYSDRLVVFTDIEEK